MSSGTYHPLKKHPANPVLGMKGSWGERRTTPYGTVLPGEDGPGIPHLVRHLGRRLPQLLCHQPGWHSLGSAEPGPGRSPGFPGQQPLLSPDPVWTTCPRLSILPGKRTPIDDTRWSTSISARALAALPAGVTGEPPPPTGSIGRIPPRNPILPDPGDVGHFLWDPNRRSYLGYTKLYAPVRGYRRRSVGVNSTTRFQHWPPTELILVPDEFDDRWVTRSGQHTDFYGLAAFPYQSQYLGFLWIFRIVDGKNDGSIFC